MRIVESYHVVRYYGDIGARRCKVMATVHTYSTAMAALKYFASGDADGAEYGIETTYKAEEDINE